jgi:hypothetical protein
VGPPCCSRYATRSPYATTARSSACGTPLPALPAPPALCASPADGADATASGGTAALRLPLPLPLPLQLLLLLLLLLLLPPPPPLLLLLLLLLLVPGPAALPLCSTTSLRWGNRRGNTQHGTSANGTCCCRANCRIGSVASSGCRPTTRDGFVLLLLLLLLMLMLLLLVVVVVAMAMLRMLAAV